MNKTKLMLLENYKRKLENRMERQKDSYLKFIENNFTVNGENYYKYINNLTTKVIALKSKLNQYIELCSQDGQDFAKRIVMHYFYEDKYKKARNLEDRSVFKSLMETFGIPSPEKCTTPEQLNLSSMHSDWKAEQHKLDSNLEIFNRRRKVLKNKEAKIDKIANKIKDVSIAINRELCDTKYEIKGSFYIDLPMSLDKEQNLEENLERNIQQSL